MKIVNIIGGLGNQMFQCAFAIALKNLYPNEEVLIDTHHYKNPYPKVYRGNNFYHNGYEVSKIFLQFNIPIASAKQINKVSYYLPNYFLSRLARRFFPIKKTEYLQWSKGAYIYEAKALTDSSKNYFEGYWMSAKYIEFCREEVIKAFEFKPFSTLENMQYADMLKEVNSISIHIRRGDYVGAKNFVNICTLDYYKKAITEAKKFINKPVYFIFSNDQEWCMENLQYLFGDAKVVFVTNNKGKESYRDMQLMSLARCNILANSSFSWWGAFLNKRKDQIVYVPSRWVNNLDDRDAYADGWIKIEV